MKSEKSRLSVICLKLFMFPVFLILINGGCDYFLPNKPPYVQKTSPVDSAIYTIGQVVNFQVNAYDVDGTVIHVAFTPPNTTVAFIDTAAPYEFAWQTAGLAEGNYDVKIMAVDNKDAPYIIKALIKLRGNPNPNAGKDATFTDSRTSYVLEAEAPAYNQGTWTIISGNGGQLSDIHNPKATLTGIPCQSYTLRWTVSNGATQLSDEVTISFSYQPSRANAGPDQVYTDGRQTATLAANSPARGSGTWTVITGQNGQFTSINDPNAVFSGQLCQVYILRWTLATPCSSKSDEVTITFEDIPSTSNAGADQNLSDGSIYTQLNATPPVNGSGLWSIISGGAGSFSDRGDPQAIFNGILCHSYVLRWTVSTSCSSSFDEVTVMLNQVAISADAGPDVRISGGSVTTFLQGNTPGIGTIGTWSIVSGEVGAIEEVNNPGSRFTGIPGQIYVLKWSFTSACIENTDLVTIAFISNLDMLDPRDEKIYQAIKIGNQVWMAENLNYSATGSYSYNNSSETASAYGRLYDWNTAITACPLGWHLPSDPEWRQLEVFLGMDASTSLLEWYRGLNEGGMMKDEGTLFWGSPNTGATNISGFTARPGGYRTSTGIFGGINTLAGFWSSTGNASDKAIYRALHKDKSQIGRDWYDKGYGFSIRCVKN